MRSKEGGFLMPTVKPEITIGTMVQIIVLITTIALAWGGFRTQMEALQAANAEMKAANLELSRKVDNLQVTVTALQVKIDMQQQERRFR